MERIDSSSARAHSVYPYVESDWWLLSELFQTNLHQAPPKLVLVRGTERRLGGKNEQQSFPTPLNEEEQKLLNSELYPPQYAHRYFYNHHLILLKTNLSEDLRNEVTHEVAHSVVALSSKVTTTFDELAEFQAFPNGIGERLSRLLNKLDFCDEFELDINEIYPPLGGAFILGHEDVRWRQNITSKLELIEQYYSKPDPDQSSLQWAARLVIFYSVPYLAGEMLADLYNGNIRSLLNDYPKLLKINGEDLWKDFCKKILTHGEL